MARIQALYLPGEAGFVLVIDQVTEGDVEAFAEWQQNGRENTGARFVLITQATLDVP
jgi:hypothetical protein